MFVHFLDILVPFLSAPSGWCSQHVFQNISKHTMMCLWIDDGNKGQPQQGLPKVIDIEYCLLVIGLSLSFTDKNQLLKASSQIRMDDGK